MWNIEQAMNECARRYHHTKIEPLAFPKADEEEMSRNRLFVEKLKQEQDMDRIVSMFLEDGTLLDLTWMKEEERQEFYHLSKQFVDDARAFDEDLGNEDIFQALRNIWIIWMLEMLFQRPLHYHQAMFGYSMLYPYSDNYLDDEQVSMEDKKNFNLWFMERLHGVRKPVDHPLLKQIDRLVSRIEDVYSRDVHPDVYESLYLIQKAQMDSLKQQRDKEHDIFAISVWKGGASVIADGYLIDGAMSEEEFQFCIDFGFGLQISDDLQDEQEDFLHEHHTLATAALSEAEHWSLFQHCWFFLKETITSFPCERESVKVFVAESCLQLLATCVLQNEEKYPMQDRQMLHDALPMEESYLEDISTYIKEKMEEFAQ